MSPPPRALLAARLFLTLGTLSFFGPIARDVNASHLLNPSWVGHARVHVMWLLCFALFSGVVNIYLLWVRRPLSSSALYLSAAWEACNILGFWASALTASRYGGITSVAGIHIHVLGMEENTAFFLCMTLTVTAALGSLKLRKQ